VGIETDDDEGREGGKLAAAINHLSVHLHRVYMDDVAPPLVKLVDVKHHASLSSNFL
jgi:hypothetical protein